MADLKKFVKNYTENFVERYLEENKEEIKKKLKFTNSLNFKFISDEVELAKLSKAKRQVYEARLKNYRDWYSVEMYTLKKGFRQGFEEGFTKTLMKDESIILKIIQFVEDGKTNEEILELTDATFKNIMEIRSALKDNS